ncbi:hypothetical protein D9M68_576470 [compost metagenome]
MCLCLPFGSGEIDYDTSLVAIEGEEIHRVIAKERFAGLTHGVPFWRFDLDHVSAEVGQKHGSERPVHHLREIQHPQPLQCTSHIVIS